MTKDTIIFGGLMGVLGNIPKSIITWIIHWMGFSTYTFEHIAAGYFVSQEYIRQPISLIIGFLADMTVTAFFGVIMYIMLRKTGTDYAVVKGAGFGALTYLIFYGALMALDVTRASLLTPTPNLALFFPHVVYGAVTCYFIKRYSGLKTTNPL